MRNEHEKNTISISERGLLRVVLISIFFYFFLDKFPSLWHGFASFLSIISPFLFGMGLAFVVNYPMTKIEDFMLRNLRPGFVLRHRRVFSLILSYLLVFGILAVLISIVVPQLVYSIRSLNYKLPVFIDSLFDQLSSYSFLKTPVHNAREAISKLDINDVYNYVGDFFNIGRSDIARSTLETLSSLSSGLLNLTFSIVFSIYALAGKENHSLRGKKMLYAFVKEPIADRIHHVIGIIYTCFFSFIGTRLIDAIIVGIITLIAMWILRLPYIGMLSVIVGFTNIIPIIGPFIGGIIGVIFIFLVSPSKALVFMLMILIIQQCDGNIIFPKLAGSSLSLPGIWTLFAVTLGGALFGILGVLIFVPMASVIYLLLTEVTERRIKEKQIVIETKQMNTK